MSKRSERELCKKLASELRSSALLGGDLRDYFTDEENKMSWIEALEKIGNKKRTSYKKNFKKLRDQVEGLGGVLNPMIDKNETLILIIEATLRGRRGE